MLFQKDKQGRIKTWETYVTREDDGRILINTEHGLMGGNITKDAGVLVTSGKNAGRANATTPEEQALSEMDSAWELKCSKGYVDDINRVDQQVVRPMLANKWPDRKKYIKFPACVQRKYDGVRCLMSHDAGAGRALAVSRMGNAFPHLDHIRVQVNGILRECPQVIFDGELYSESLDFNTLVGLVKRHELNPEDQHQMLLVKYRVYDCIDLRNPDLTFADRVKTLIPGLTSRVSPAESCHIGLVENFTAETAEDIDRLLGQFIEEGYEGAMIRNWDSPYEINHRSNSLLKYKKFESGEFKIVGFEEAVGNDAGTVIWVCETKNGDRFTSRMKATREERRKMFKEGQSYVGKMLTIKYQELSQGSDNVPPGIPRFNVGIAIRDYE